MKHSSRLEGRNQKTSGDIGPDFAFYEVKELPLIGGPLFVASALDTRELIGQFESNDFGVPQHALGDLRALQNAAMFSLVASTGRRSLSAEVGPVGLGPCPTAYGNNLGRS
jgi:hypothetical protein